MDLNSRLPEVRALTKVTDFDQFLAESTMSEENPNDILFLEDAGLVTSYPQSWIKEEQKNSECRLKLIATVCSVCLVINLWPFQFLPLIIPFFWWVNSRGYLTLWEE